MWFTENPWPPAFVAGTVALICFFLWLGNKRGLHFILAVALLIVTGGIFLVERAIVTESERIEGYVEDLCWSFQRRDQERTLAYFSQQAPAWRLVCAALMLRVEVRDDLRVTDISVRMLANQTRAISRFRATASIAVAGAGDVGQQHVRFELTWQREGNDWKIIEVRRLHPLKDEEIGIESGK